MNSVLKAGKPRQNPRMKEMREELTCGSKMVKFSMNVPRSLHSAFKRKTFLADLDMSDVLLEAIQNYMRE